MKHIYLLLLIILSFSSDLCAQELWGGEISTKAVSSKKYEVTLRLFYNCAQPAPSAASIFMMAGSSAFSLAGNKQYDKPVYRVCDTVNAGICNGQYGGRAIREVAYKTTFDLNQNPYKAALGSNCEVYFYYNYSGRKSAITTLNASDAFYIESMVNVCNAPDISSPAFTAVPLFQACCNSGFHTTVNAGDAGDADSIAYKLEPALKSHNISASYTGSFTDRYPITPYCPPNAGVVNCNPIPKAKPPRGTYLDIKSGNMVVTPTNCSEVAVIATRAYYFVRDKFGVMQPAGYVGREFTLAMETCADNNPPEILVTYDNYTLCEGDKVCFTINSSDNIYSPNQTIADSTEMAWDSAIAGATFIIKNPNNREKSAEFCWQTHIGDARQAPYSFTTEVNDRHCPATQYASQAFVIYVIPRPAATRKYGKYNNSFLKMAIQDDSTTESYTVFWVVRDSIDMSVIYSGGGKSAIAQLPANGKYVVTCTITSPLYNCSIAYKDTVNFNPGMVSLHEMDLKDKVSFYPNPAHHTLSLLLSDVPERVAVVRAYDMAGRELYHKTTADRELHINTSDWPRGIVVIKVEMDGATSAHKVLLD